MLIEETPLTEHPPLFQVDLTQQGRCFDMLVPNDLDRNDLCTGIVRLSKQDTSKQQTANMNS